MNLRRQVTEKNKVISSHDLKQKATLSFIFVPVFPAKLWLDFLKEKWRYDTPIFLFCFLKGDFESFLAQFFTICTKNFGIIHETNRL